MTIHTTYSGQLDAKTGNDELDSLLSEIRRKTGRSWQCEITSNRSGYFGRAIDGSDKHYELLLYVGGVMPYQLIMAGSGSINTIKGFLIGYLSGLENNQSGDQHFDDKAFDNFTIACKKKLASARAKGRGGWNDKANCSGEYLAKLLIEHLSKGNAGTFEDVANFAMMLHQRGEDPKLLSNEMELVKESAIRAGFDNKAGAPDAKAYINCRREASFMADRVNSTSNQQAD